MKERGEREQGFTLVELMIAMVVTLMVTGAIYGLLAGGQGAFRREPELTDRQQNIRTAMDMIMRDIAAAGSGMPGWIQTFTPGLDGASLASCVDNTGGSVTCPEGASGDTADELEMVSNPNNYAMEDACFYPGMKSANVRLRSTTTRVTENSVVMIIMKNGTWTMRNINGGVNTTSGNPIQGCNAADHQNVQFMPGQDRTNFNLAGGLCAGTEIMSGTPSACVGCSDVPGNACCNDTNEDCTPLGILEGEIIRYRIRYENGVPNLERFSSALANVGFNAGGVRQFQVVARGIDDLQVRYTYAPPPIYTPTDVDDAPLVDQTQKNYGSLIQSVTVTLSARSEARNIAGMTRSGSGVDAIRGTLTSTGTPRAVLVTLGTRVELRDPAWGGPSPYY